MSENQEVLEAIRAAIDGLTQEQKLKVNECASLMRRLVFDYGECGPMALALVGAEKAAE